MQGLRRHEFASLFSEGISTDLDDPPGARRLRREAIYRETFTRWYSRQITSISDIGDLMGTIGPRESVRALLQAQRAPRRSGISLEPCHPAGFCGLGSDLSPTTLVSAYTHGMFARPLFGAIAWWAPSTYAVSDPQMPGCLEGISGLADCQGFRVTLDRDFDTVVAACAGAPNSASGGSCLPSWLRNLRTGFSPRLMRAIAALHDLGMAHSFEVWDANDRLVAGGFGVAVGAVFVCEGLFSRCPNAERLGFAKLNEHLADWGYVLCAADCHLLKSINRPVVVLWRSEYVRLIRTHLGGGRYGRWRSERPPTWRPSRPCDVQFTPSFARI
jgi:leucyl/phenylalanyl-tRNA--protein transferase